jgi:hypothetical protein
MFKYDLAIRHKHPRVYNVLYFEKWLNDYKSNGLRLLKNEKNNFYFKKSSILDFEYFVMVSRYEYKMLLDISGKKTAIDPTFVENYLNENNIKYSCVSNKDTYIYLINGINKCDLDTIKLYRYLSTLKFSKQENSIYKGMILIYFIILILALFLCIISAFVFCAILICILGLKLHNNNIKLNNLKQSLN